MSDCVLKLMQEPGCEDLPVPHYQTNGSAGMDLYAAVDGTIRIEPGEVALVRTGIRIALPHGYEAQIRPRSGLALKHGIGLLNSPGTVDADYRGVVSVIIFNFGKSSFLIRRGDRIAQMIISKVQTAEIQLVAELSETQRGDGGFGSTGR